MEVHYLADLEFCEVNTLSNKINSRSLSQILLFLAMNDSENVKITIIMVKI
jgi:hypothetical protein